MAVIKEQNLRESGYHDRKYGVMTSDKFKKDRRYETARKEFTRPVTNYGGGMIGDKYTGVELNSVNILTNN